jgi:hypothetical protein
MTIRYSKSFPSLIKREERLASENPWSWRRAPVGDARAGRVLRSRPQRGRPTCRPRFAWPRPHARAGDTRKNRGVGDRLPLLRPRLGDTLRITFRNNLPGNPSDVPICGSKLSDNPSNLHFHGMAVSPQGNSVSEPVSLCIVASPSVPLSAQPTRLSYLELCRGRDL